MEKPRVDISRLRSLYEVDPVVKATMDHFAGRERNQNQTPVDRLYSLLEADGVTFTRGQIIDAFRKIEDAGCGVFKVGRKGHQSRFEWAFGTRDAGRAARGENVDVSPAEKEPFGEEEPQESMRASVDTVDHRFRLRDDFEVSIRVPANFSIKEAERMAIFLKSLPIE